MLTCCEGDGPERPSCVLGPLRHSALRRAHAGQNLRRGAGRMSGAGGRGAQPNPPSCVRLARARRGSPPGGEGAVRAVYPVVAVEAGCGGRAPAVGAGRAVDTSDVVQGDTAADVSRGSSGRASTLLTLLGRRRALDEPRDRGLGAGPLWASESAPPGSRGAGIVRRIERTWSRSAGRVSSRRRAGWRSSMRRLDRARRRRP